MVRNIIWSLLILNVALLALLIGRSSPADLALAQQPLRAIRPPTDVSMIPGNLPSGSNAVLYLLDTGNHQLGAMAYDGNRVEFLAAPLDLDRIFQGAAGTVGTGAAGGAAGTVIPRR